MIEMPTPGKREPQNGHQTSIEAAKVHLDLACKIMRENDFITESDWTFFREYITVAYINSYLWQEEREKGKGAE